MFFRKIHKSKPLKTWSHSSVYNTPGLTSYREKYLATWMWLLTFLFQKPRALICSHEAPAPLGLSFPFGLHDTAEKSFCNYFDGYCSCDMIGDHSIQFSFSLKKLIQFIIVDVWTKQMFFFTSVFCYNPYFFSHSRHFLWFGFFSWPYYDFGKKKNLNCAALISTRVLSLAAGIWSHLSTGASVRSNADIGCSGLAHSRCARSSQRCQVGLRSGPTLWWVWLCAHRLFTKLLLQGWKGTIFLNIILRVI